MGLTFDSDLRSAANRDVLTAAGAVGALQKQFFPTKQQQATEARKNRELDLRERLLGSQVANQEMGVEIKQQQLQNQQLQQEANFGRAGNLINSKNKIVKSLVGKMSPEALARSPKTMDQAEELGARAEGSMQAVQEMVDGLGDNATAGQLRELQDIQRELNSGNIGAVTAANDRLEKLMSKAAQPATASEAQAAQIAQIKQANPALATLTDNEVVKVDSAVSTVISNIANPNTTPAQIQNLQDRIELANEGDEEALKSLAKDLGTDNPTSTVAAINSLQGKVNAVQAENNARRSANLEWSEKASNTNPAAATAVDDEGNARTVGGVNVQGIPGKSNALVSMGYAPGKQLLFKEGVPVGIAAGVDEAGNAVVIPIAQAREGSIKYYEHRNTDFEALQDRSRDIKRRYKTRARELDAVGETEKANFLRERIGSMDTLGISKSALAKRADDLSEKRFNKKADILARQFKEDGSFMNKLSAAAKRTGVSISEAMSDVASAVGSEQDPGANNRAKMDMALDEFEASLNSIYAP